MTNSSCSHGELAACLRAGRGGRAQSKSELVEIHFCLDVVEVHEHILDHVFLSLHEAQCDYVQTVPLMFSLKRRKTWHYFICEHA